MLAEDLAFYFESQGLGVRGQTLFTGSLAVLPDGDGPFVRLTEYGGLPAVRAGGGTVVFEQPRVQITVTGKDDLAARQRAYAAHRVCLHATDFHPLMLAGCPYLRLEPQQPPFDLGPDTTNRARLVFNLAVWKKATAA